MSQMIDYFERHELPSERTEVIIKILKNIRDVDPTIHKYKFIIRHIKEYALWVGRTEEILTSFPGTAIPLFFEHAHEFYYSWEIT